MNSDDNIRNLLEHVIKAKLLYFTSSMLNEFFLTTHRYKQNELRKLVNEAIKSKPIGDATLSNIKKYIERKIKAEHQNIASKDTIIEFIIAMRRVAINKSIYKKSLFQINLNELLTKAKIAAQNKKKDNNPEILQSLEYQRYWFYYYDYKNASKNEVKIRRKILSFKKSETISMEVVLESQFGNTQYTGDAFFVDNNNILVCDLKGDAKRQILYIHHNSSRKDQEADFFPGIYLKYNKENEPYAGNFFIESVSETNKEKNIQSLSYLSEEINEIPENIKEFFRLGKSTYLETIRAFTNNALKKELDKKNRRKQFDIFLAWPLLSLNKVLQKTEETQNLIIEKLNYWKVNEKQRLGELANFSELEDEISKILREIFLDEKKIVVGKKIEQSNEKFRTLILKLKTNLEEKLNFNVFNSRDNIDPEREKPGVLSTLKKDWSHLNQSKALMLICPYPEMFSSCWVEIGWAMALNIPIFICLLSNQTEKDILPFILSERPNERDFQIYFLKVKSVDQIPDIYKKIRLDGHLNKFY